jgi:biotin transporter BioY
MDEIDGQRFKGVVVQALGLIFGLLIIFGFGAAVMLFGIGCVFLVVVAANQLLVLGGWGWDGYFVTDDPPPAWYEVAFVGLLMFSPIAVILFVATTAMVRHVRNRLSRRSPIRS